MWKPVEELPLVGKTEAVPAQYIPRADVKIELYESHLLLAFVPLDVGYMYRLAYLRVVAETFPDGKLYNAIEWVGAGDKCERIFPSHWDELPEPPANWDAEPESNIVVPENKLILPE